MRRRARWSPRAGPWRVATLPAAALLLAWPAFWNGYPLVFADTGTYLGQTLLRYLGWDRPPFYSLFLLATSGRASLFLPVAAQALLTAWLLGIVLRVQGLAGNGVPLLAAAAGLALLTGLPWFVAQLMPDLFAGLLVLAFWLIGFRWRMLRRAERLALPALATLAIAVHQSHLPLAFGLAVLGTALRLLGDGGAAARRVAPRLLLPPLVAALGFLAVNAVGHGRLGLSPFGPVFFAARLIDDGPGMAHLRAACAADPARYRICPHLDRFGPHHNAFLWSADSPLAGPLGGPKAWAPEARAIIVATLREAPVAVGRSMAANTLRQLRLLRTGDGLEAWPDVPGPGPLIARFFPAERPAFEAARQQRGLLEAEARGFAPLHAALGLGGLAALALLLVLRRPAMGLPERALAGLVLAAAIGNAAVTGALSVPTDRYQARLAWLFVLAPGLALAGAAVSRSAGPARAGGGAAPAA